jgi:uroporphyrinogen-III synthase
MPDSNIHILSTRPVKDSLIQEAAAAGIQLDSTEFIFTNSITDRNTILSVKEIIAEKTTVVFTSMNAVEAVVKVLNNLSPDWDIYCIGHTTQKQILQGFHRSHIKGTADNAVELARLILQDGNIGELVFFCGDRRRDELPEILISNGLQLKEIIVYQTRMTPAHISPDYDAILFFSPSAVESFFSLNTLPASTIPFAIGNTTAEAISMYCSNPVQIADEPGKDALVKMAVTHFMNK